MRPNVDPRLCRGLAVGFLLSLATIGLAAIVVVASSRADSPSTPLSCDGKPVAFHVERAKTIIENAYAHERWQDPTPATDADKRTWRDHRRCVLDSERRKRIGVAVDKAQASFNRYRARRQITPYYGEGRWWAIPFSIVACETRAYSGRGRYSALNESSGAGGAYQVLPSTWQTYGGSGSPHLAPPREQDVVAHRIWVADGASAWSCA